MRRQKNQSLADFTTADIANFWLLYTINNYFPMLRHLFETRGGHPEELYAAMLSLAGALTTFSLKIHPRDLPLYDHDDLGPCFTDLDEKLRLLLETVVPSNFVSLPLKLVQPAIYATSIDQDKYLVNTKMYLAVNAEMNQADLINKTPHLIKVCSANHIEHLVRQALPGVPLTHVATPPSSIPMKLNFQYFSMSQTGLAWEAITRARNLAAYVPGDFPNPQLEADHSAAASVMTAGADAAAEMAVRFVAGINAHDVEAICRLMAEDFVFVDSLGRAMKGRETMRPGWEGYFRLFPDYQIAIEDTFVAGAAIALFGTAQGTLSKQGETPQENHWQVPAVWKAVARDGHIAEWRIYADNYQTAKMIRGE